MKATSADTTRRDISVRDCLVAVVSTDSNLHQFLDHGLYRIPARALGRSLSAGALEETQVLALYQSRRVGDGLGGAIEIWGEIAERRIAARRDIIPSEPNHPSANDLYHLLRVGEVRQLERPIVARRPRRVIFLRTTRDRLFAATDLNDLVVGSPAEERLWEGLLHESPRMNPGEVERRCYLRCGGMVMEVDFAIHDNRGILGVICGEGGREYPEAVDAPVAWRVVRFSEARLHADLVGCVGDVVEEVRRMRGGGI